VDVRLHHARRGAALRRFQQLAACDVVQECDANERRTEARDGGMTFGTTARRVRLCRRRLRARLDSSSNAGRQSAVARGADVPTQPLILHCGVVFIHTRTRWTYTYTRALYADMARAYNFIACLASQDRGQRGASRAQAGADLATQASKLSKRRQLNRETKSAAPSQPTSACGAVRCEITLRARAMGVRSAAVAARRVLRSLRRNPGAERAGACAAASARCCCCSARALTRTHVPRRHSSHVAAVPPPERASGGLEPHGGAAPLSRTHAAVAPCAALQLSRSRSRCCSATTRKVIRTHERHQRGTLCADMSSCGHTRAVVSAR
jgi:hypothetical protein